MRKPYMIPMLLLVLIAFVSGCMPTESVPRVRLLENDRGEERVKDKLSVGEKVQAGGWEITLQSYRWEEGPLDVNELITYWRIKNISERESFMSLTLATALYNAAGEQQDYIERDGAEEIAYQGIKPGEKIEIEYGWIVEEGGEPFTLKFNLGSLYEKETLVWLLEK